MSQGEASDDALIEAMVDACLTNEGQEQIDAIHAARQRLRERFSELHASIGRADRALRLLDDTFRDERTRWLAERISLRAEGKRWMEAYGAMEAEKARWQAERDSLTVSVKRWRAAYEKSATECARLKAISYGDR